MRLLLIMNLFLYCLLFHLKQEEDDERMEKDNDGVACICMYLSKIILMQIDLL